MFLFDDYNRLSFIIITAFWKKIVDLWTLSQRYNEEENQLQTEMKSMLKHY